MKDSDVKDNLPYGRQTIGKDDIYALADVMVSPFLTTGPAVAEFEAELSKRTKARYTLACSSGTAALHLACMALDLGPGDLGLTSPNSFLASANCIEYCGGTTDFIDIDPSTLCLSPEKLDAYLETNSAPRVVIPVDFAGRGADLGAIHRLSQQYGFAVIEDAAHSLGSEYRVAGKTFACGSCAHSDLAVFSFHPVKTITTGEGGAVTTNDKSLYEKMLSLRNHGMEKHSKMLEHEGPWYYEMHQLGLNYRITDIQCALGISQLKKLDAFKTRRQEIVGFYNRSLADVAGLILPGDALSDLACPHLYPIQIRSGAQARRQVHDRLKEEGIHCQVHYIPIYWQPYYAEKYGYRRGKCPASEAYYSKALSLPLYPELADKDAQRVVEALVTALKRIDSP